MSAAWPTVALGELLSPALREQKVDPSGEYPLLGVRLDGQGPFHRETVLGTQTSASRLYEARAGDFIYSRLFAWRGAFGLIEPELDGHFVSNEFPTFVPKGGRLDPKYLRYWFRLPDVLRRVEADCSGSTPLTRNRYKEHFFFALKIPLPPLNKQRRIVARIEELAAKVEKAKRARIESARETGALKDSYLRLLFEKLRRSPNLEVGELCDVRGGIQKSPDRAPGANPVRYVTVAHVQRDRLDITDERYFEVVPEELERWRLKSGDVLIIEGNGSADQIGRACLFRGEIQDCVHQNHVIRLRPDARKLDPEYLNVFLNSPAGRDEVQALSRTTSGLRTLSVGRIRSIKLPVPSFPEQRRFVEQARAHGATINQSRVLQSETAAELNAMLPAILDKAFNGEL